MEDAALYAFMSGQRYGVLSSICPAGTPQSALVGIAVTADLEIVFDTVRSSRKYPNLIAQPKCCFVLGWEGEQTVQFEGTAFEPKGAELERYRQIYFEPWPDGRDRLDWPGLIHMVVRPHWVRYSGFAQIPPFLEERTFL